MRGIGDNGRNPSDPERGGLPEEGRQEGARGSRTVVAEHPRRDVSPAPRRPCATIDEVIEEYTPYAHAIVVRAGMEHEADTILQEVFVGVDRYLRKKRAPRDLEDLVAAITWRRIYDLLRVRYREQARRGEADVDATPDSLESPDALLLLAQRKQAVHRALDAMPAREAMLIRVVDLAERPQRELAAELHWNENTLRVRVGRARKMLYALLKPLLG